MSNDLEWSLKLEICRLELAKERMHAAESALATEELRRFLAEAQAEVERLRDLLAVRDARNEPSRSFEEFVAEQQKACEVSGVMGETEELKLTACEGERVDINELAREVVTEVDYHGGWWREFHIEKVAAILRRHFRPAAPKPAAGGEKPAKALPADDGERVKGRRVTLKEACELLDKQVAERAAREREQRDRDAEEMACWECREKDKQLAAQAAELDALRPDKRRLDWLVDQKLCRNAINYPWVTTCESGTMWRILYPVGMNRQATIRPDLREAIDAAIAAKEDKANA